MPERPYFLGMNQPSCDQYRSGIRTYLDCAGSNVTVVGKTRGKGRAIIESVLGLPLGKFKLLLEGIDLLPILKDLLLLLREVRSLGNYIQMISIMAGK